MKIKKILPFIASLTLLSGSVLLLTACGVSKINNDNLPLAKLSNKLNNRVLFDFLGVNFTKNVGDQFNETYSDEGLNLILSDIQGTMAKLKFYEFFHDKLGYTPDQVNLVFEKVKDDLGLSLLTRDYFKGFNTSNSLDKVSIQDNNNLLFQTQSWHQSGTSIFNYNDVSFYKQINDETKLPNNPDEIFNNDNLYKDHDNDEAFDKQIISVAKHADQNYSDEINILLPSTARTWKSDADINKLQPNIDISKKDSISVYQKKLKRFQWLLRFRYQQYYQYQILPQLNKTLFTMSWILNNLFNITHKYGTPNITTSSNNIYIGQLQDIHQFKTSNYRQTWDFTTSLPEARNFNDEINKSRQNRKNQKSAGSFWKAIVENDSKLNSDFLKQFYDTAKMSSNFYNIDPNFGFNGFNNTINNKVASLVVATDYADWITFPGGIHYIVNDNGKYANFIYTAPIYFLNIIQNLDFGYPMMTGDKDWIPVDNHLIKDWNNSNNKSIDTVFSKYLRNKDNQAQKWNIFWQMLYSIADSTDTGANKTKIDANFNSAAKNMFLQYIPKEQFYELKFWKKVAVWYP